MTTQDQPNNESFELRDFPADVQDILKQRAVEKCQPMAEIMQEYILETSQLISSTSAA